MRVIACLCLAAAVAACGVNGQSNAHVFDTSEVPYGLTDTAPSTPAPSTQAPPFVSTTTASVAYDLYFIRANILVPVTRRAVATPSPADLVATLVEGPTPAESSRTALPSAELVTRVRESATTVTVDLARTFNDIPRGDRILALGQITLTLTARPGVSLVQYTIADTPIEVPKANGVVTRDPVSRADYTTLLSPPNSSQANNAPTTSATLPTLPTTSR